MGFVSKLLKCPLDVRFSLVFAFNVLKVVSLCTNCLVGEGDFFVQRKTTLSTLKATCHELSCLLPHLVQTSFLAKGRFAAGGSAPPPTRPSAPLFLDVLYPCSFPSASLARPLPPGMGPAP